MLFIISLAVTMVDPIIIGVALAVTVATRRWAIVANRVGVGLVLGGIIGLCLASFLAESQAHRDHLITYTPLATAIWVAILCGAQKGLMRLVPKFRRR